MSGTVLLRAGSWLSLDGEAVEVVSPEGAAVTVRDAAGTWQAVGTAALLARAALAERAGHVREMLTGYRSGSEQAPRPGEPRPQFARGVPVSEREQAKAAELGVTARTVRRWARAYREGGEAALADERKGAGRGTAVDPRWEDAAGPSSPSGRASRPRPPGRCCGGPLPGWRRSTGRDGAGAVSRDRLPPPGAGRQGH